MRVLVALLISFALTLPSSGSADDDDAMKRISRLLEAGEILPLTKILEIVEPVTGVNILEIEVEEEDFGLAYGIYFLDSEGRRREIYVDPRDGKILMQKLGD